MIPTAETDATRTELNDDAADWGDLGVAAFRVKPAWCPEEAPKNKGPPSAAKALFYQLHELPCWNGGFLALRVYGRLCNKDVGEELSSDLAQLRLEVKWVGSRDISYKAFARIIEKAVSCLKEMQTGTRHDLFALEVGQLIALVLNQTADHDFDDSGETGRVRKCWTEYRAVLRTRFEFCDRLVSRLLTFMNREHIDYRDLVPSLVPILDRDRLQLDARCWTAGEDDAVIVVKGLCPGYLTVIENVRGPAVCGPSDFGLGTCLTVRAVSKENVQFVAGVQSRGTMAVTLVCREGLAGEVRDLDFDDVSYETFQWFAEF